jgi:hypothetical protein
MGLAITILGFLVCMLILEELLATAKQMRLAAVPLVAWIGRLLGLPLLWLYLAAFLLTVTFASKAAPLAATEGPVQFACLLAWLSLLSVLAKLVTARSE